MMDSQNPYTPPSSDSHESSPQSIPSRSRALKKVRIPAIIMMFYGALLVLVGIALPIIVSNEPGPDRTFFLTIFAVVGLVFALVGVFTIFAAVSMMNLRRYGMSFASVITSFILTLLFCLPLIVVGIWPLVVLLDHEVKSSFR